MTIDAVRLKPLDTDTDKETFIFQSPPCFFNLSISNLFSESLLDFFLSSTVLSVDVSGRMATDDSLDYESWGQCEADMFDARKQVSSKFIYILFKGYVDTTYMLGIHNWYFSEAIAPIAPGHCLGAPGRCLSAPLKCSNRDLQGILHCISNACILILKRVVCEICPSVADTLLTSWTVVSRDIVRVLHRVWRHIVLLSIPSLHTLQSNNVTCMRLHLYRKWRYALLNIVFLNSYYVDQ